MTNQELLELLKKARKTLNKYHVPKDEQTVTLSIDTLETALSEQPQVVRCQEAIAPYQHDAVWMCGNCDKEGVGWTDDFTGDDIRYPYCRQCGKAVKWK